MVADGIHRPLLVLDAEIDLAGILIAGNAADELAEAYPLFIEASTLSTRMEARSPLSE